MGTKTEQSRFSTTGILLAVFLGLNGCALSPVVEVVGRQKEFPECAGLQLHSADGKLTLAKFIRHMKDENATTDEILDGFLDCAIGKVNDDNHELKLYRGYIILAILVRYGAFNYTGAIGTNLNVDFRAYAEIADDAASLLGRIETAERMLRSASSTAPLADTGTDTDTDYGIMAGTELDDEIPSVLKLHRVMSVLLVATAAEKPTIKRAKGIIVRLVTAIAQQSLLSGRDFFQDGLAVVGKGLTLKTFGNAYLTDARKEIGRLNESGETPSLEDWQSWGRLISDACERIGHIAQTKPHCVGE